MKRKQTRRWQRRGRSLMACGFVVTCLASGAVAAQQSAPKTEEDAANSTAPKAETAPSATKSPERKARLKLLVTDLRVSGVESRVSSALTQLVAAEVSKRDVFEVISGEDLRRMIELEAEREAMGCTNDASCLAEVAGALGAQRVVFGDISRLGSNFILTLTLLDSVEASTVGRATVKIPGEDALAEAVPALVAKILGEEAPAPVVAPTAEDAPVEGGGALLPLTVLAVGGVTALIGVVGVGVGLFPVIGHTLARSDAEALAGSATVDDLEEAKRLQGVQEDFNGQWQSYGAIALGIGAGLVVVGLAASGAGAGLWALSGDDSE